MCARPWTQRGSGSLQQPVSTSVSTHGWEMCLSSTVYQKSNKGVISLVLGPHQLLHRQKNTGRKAAKLTDQGIQPCAEADWPPWSFIEVVIAAFWPRCKTNPDCRTERAVCFQEQFSPSSGPEDTDTPHLPWAASQGCPPSLPRPGGLAQLHLGALSSLFLRWNGLGLSNARIRDPFWSFHHLSGVVQVYLALA